MTRPAPCSLRAWALGLALALGCAPATLKAQSAPDAKAEILLLAPVSGSTVFSNPFLLKGRIEGSELRRVSIESASQRGSIRMVDRRFRIPMYLWADSAGKVVETTLRSDDGGEGSVLVLKYTLESYDPAAIDGDLAQLSTRLVTDPTQAVTFGRELAEKLFQTGHPIFAHVVLERLAPHLGDSASLAEGEALRLAVLALEVDVLLGHDDEVGVRLEALQGVAQGADRKTLARTIGERIFTLSDLALIYGERRKLASQLLEAGNSYFREAGLLPRRLLKGY